MNKRLVVIDTDAGLDDALALLICLRAHKEESIHWRIVGITCVHGNTSLDNVCVNVSRVVRLAELEDEIPIFRGAERPLVHRTEVRSSFYHGSDGFGDANLEPIEMKIEKENAALALIRLAHEYEGRLTVITLGPLTNIALAINLDPTFSESLKELCIMGGNIWGVGNIQACSEFNFWADPESVHVVLGSPFQQPILQIPWETCKLEAKFSLEWRLEVIGKLNTKEAIFLNTIEEKILERNAVIHSGWVSCDALVPAVMLNSRLTEKTESHFGVVELNGTHTRGQMVLDHPRISGKPNNLLIVTKINMAEYENMILWGLYGMDEAIDFSVNNHILFVV